MTSDSRDEIFPNDFVVNSDEHVAIDLNEINKDFETIPCRAKGPKSVRGTAKTLSQTQHLEISRLVAETRWKKPY